MTAPTRRSRPSRRARRDGDALLPQADAQLPQADAQLPQADAQGPVAEAVA